ncbi:glycoside hydrolase, partial [bacterium]|nr:glycoside hydrolase [bacterium]
PGPFHIQAKLAIHNLQGSAASFVVDKEGSNFGFSGGSGKPFIEGAFFQSSSKTLGALPIEEGKPFQFDVVREDGRITFSINETLVYEMESPQDVINQVGFRPWRSTMRIYDFSIQGVLIEPLNSQPRGYSIPVIDLSSQTERQVIVDQEDGQYLGHPTTVLLEDQATMIAVYPKGHGRGSIVMKRSTDGGLTWSERLSVPENWATSLETPTIHRVVDAQGVRRLILFSGLYPIRMSVSEDDGLTWTPLQPIGDFGGIVAMSDVIQTRSGQYQAYFHDDGRFLHNEGKTGAFIVYKTRSDDGGLTWSAPEEVVSHPVAHLCEPGLVKSPDGSQWLMLLRENSRQFNSFYCVSNDEGETWSAPKQLPGALTGDRHVVRYAPDGRLVITFRDMAHQTSTYGDFVAWVGTYNNIVNGREGQYRIRLLDNQDGVDTGYAGMEVLPDVTFVSTTYCHLYEGEPPLIASVRYKLSELDAIAEQMKLSQQDLFVSGENGYASYRIPSLLVSKQGSLLAFCEGRKNSSSDHGDIDLVERRSTDGGATWSQQSIVYEEGGGQNITIGNPCPVVDQDTGRIWMTYCRDNDDVFALYSDDDGVSWSKPVSITSSVKKPGWSWYATGPGVGIQKKMEPHKGRLIIPCDHREAVNGQSVKMSHIFYSDDGGETWELGGTVGLHTDECQLVELSNGDLMINMRN